MARAMSSAALAALSGTSTREVFLFLLEITLTIDGTAETYRFVNNNEKIIRNGQTYLPLAFKLTLPNEGEHVAGTSIVIDAVDRTIIEVLRKTTTQPEVSFILILGSAPNGDPEAGPFTFNLKDISYTKSSLSATLVYGNHLESVFPRVIKTPHFFPALF